MKQTVMLLIILMVFAVTGFAQDHPMTVSSLNAMPLAAYFMVATSSDASGGANTDRCANYGKTQVVFSQAAAGPLTIIPGVTGRQTFLCSIFMVTAATQNINLVEGTGADCSSVSAGLLGGVTAATGANLAANSQLVLGNGGWTVAATATEGDHVCLISSSTGQISGVITYVQK